MTPSEEHGLRIAIDIFHKKSQRLVQHRHPNIYLKSNDELFSNWFEDGLEEYDIQKLGANAHPDIIINSVGFELKSLRTNGQIQFNSTIPCGGFKHNDITGECYYAVARYKTERMTVILKTLQFVMGISSTTIVSRHLHTLMTKRRGLVIMVMEYCDTEKCIRFLPHYDEYLGYP
jgi:hypothetical protein